tara:strand:+ start:2574 stop:3653 length:1080 start_codon:yes stop_codon:yes gene_type:complete
MASSASPDLKIQLMATGENSGAWGTITNNNLSAIEEAIARTTDVTFANDTPTASVTLTDSNALQAGRNFRLNLIGTGTAGHVLLLPTVEKSYLINNTLSVDVSVRNGTAAGTNLFNTQTVPAGGAAIVYTDGSAVTSAVSSASAMEVLNALSVGGAASVGTTLGVTGNASVTGTFTFATANSTGNLGVVGNASVGGTLGITNNASVTGTFTFATANSTGNLGVVGNASVGGTLLSTGGVSDADGSLRQVPQSRSIAGAATSIATAAITDIGNYIFLTGGSASIQTLVIPDGIFTAGDIFSVVNSAKTADSTTTTFSAAQVSAVIAGAASATTLITLGVNGVASVLFTNASACIITGNVS